MELDLRFMEKYKEGLLYNFYRDAVEEDYIYLTIAHISMKYLPTLIFFSRVITTNLRKVLDTAR